MRKICLRLVPLCFPFLLFAQSPLPRFEDYRVTEEWQGPAAPLQLDRRARWFKTKLSEAAKQGPDFAGHYRFAGWGCGSVCAAGAIVDLKTGVVYPPPLGGHGTDPKNIYEYWIFTGGPIGVSYTEYRVDSRLVIVRGSTRKFSDLTVVDTYYLVWEGDKFRQIMFLPGKPKHQ